MSGAYRTLEVGDEELLQLSPGDDVVPREVVKQGVCRSLEHEREVEGAAKRRRTLDAHGSQVVLDPGLRVHCGVVLGCLSWPLVAPRETLATNGGYKAFGADIIIVVVVCHVGTLIVEVEVQVWGGVVGACLHLVVVDGVSGIVAG